jgi:hypothetical protein
VVAKAVDEIVGHKAIVTNSSVHILMCAHQVRHCEARSNEATQRDSSKNQTLLRRKFRRCHCV